jgi:hypothetical protein
MSGYEDDLARWLRDADKRERAEQDRHKQILDVHRQGYDLIARVIEEGFKVLHDLIIDGRR